MSELSVENILSVARMKARLDNVYDSSLGSRLTRLVKYLNEQASLDELGKAAAVGTVGDLLARRACLLNDHDRYPEIGREVVERPIIVTGFARSGTTLLNMLIGQHPDNRIPEWWETTRPSPPPALAGPLDSRRKDSDRDIADLLSADPSLLVSHPYFDAGGRTAAECEAFGALNLQIVRRTLYFRIPALITLNLMDDPLDFYRFHKKVLQQLQWKMTPRRWALKGVEHHARLEALKAVYPDAIVIWLHRDPLKVFPSVFELNARLIEGTLGHPVERVALGTKLMKVYGDMLDAAASSPLIEHPDVHHVLYSDFASAPVKQIAAIYRRFDLPFDDAAGRAMQSWLDSPDHRGDRHGKFEYSLDAFGMTPDTLERRFASYRAKFNIPFEGKRP